MEEVEAQYQEFLDKIAQKYKGRTFCYNPPVSNEDADLTLIGRNGLRLEFQDARGSFDYLSIEDFLQLAQTPPKRTEPERCGCGGVETVVSSPIDTVETCKSCGGIKKDG